MTHSTSDQPFLQGIVNLIKTLQKRGVAVYMISGGFREDIMPIAKFLGVPKENVFANRMNWCVWASVQDIDILWPRS
jgi:phosphoserine phosphatase